MEPITDQTIYKTAYCTNFTGDFCHEWTTIQSLEKNDVKELGVDMLFSASILIVAIFFVLFLFKALFYIVRGGKGKF